MSLHIQHTAVFLLIGKSMEGMKRVTMALPAWQIAIMVWGNRTGTCSWLRWCYGQPGPLTVMINGKPVSFHSKDTSHVGVKSPSLPPCLIQF